MLREFKDFLLKGNLIEVAVALVLALALTAVVTSLVEDLITPLIAALFGQPDFSGLTFEINDSVFRYGEFLNALLAFVVIGAVLFFFVVKPVNALTARLDGAAEEGTPDEERRHQELLAALARISR
jgi:large conductance mechanosensitive channel